MASKLTCSCLVLLVLVCMGCGICCYGEGMVPAVYVFGDSLADVGNNNHLDLSIIKADFPHNGVDYPGRKATGRFGNGKNSADFLAEKLGLPTSPPYLSISSNSNASAFVDGVNFASGGAGVLDSTNSDQCIALNKQIDYYSTVYGALVQQLGSDQAQSHLAKSIFVIVIGSNDMLHYVKSSSQNKLKSPQQQFVDSLVSSLDGQLKRIYNLGARKFAFIGTGPIGCCPSMRKQNKTEGCNQEANDMSVLYNKGVTSLLQNMATDFGDMSYSFFDTSLALLEYIQQPATYGFAEVKAACCGLGDLNAKIACIPISTYCANRSDHIFWDFYHPTETTAGMLSSTAFDESAPYVYPMNIRQLAAL
ncbi:GDSL esterase/lipase At5g55050 [Ananas comosus]|uniref:GDSL esterase/lipase At5g55050 n=1 Tax=Ananas comosus TaxID=4615 RepID=A0A6P5FDG0_ANACO|nr:GDSL esterase/lipase At5g55050 [Ananas comosus]